MELGTIMSKPDLVAVNNNESTVLELLRTKKYSRIEIQMKDVEAPQ
jgi:Holliday junction resolvase